MFDTTQQRGRAIAVVGVVAALCSFALGAIGERLVEAEAAVAAGELEAVLDQFDSVGELIFAMAGDGLGVPAGASVAVVDDQHAVAWMEVRALAETRCVRVASSAAGVDGELRIDETLVLRRPCGSTWG